MDDHSAAQCDDFVRHENIRRYESEFGTETEPQRCATLLHLLVEEENRLGWNREQLAIAESRISEGNRRIENQIALIQRLTDIGQDTSRAKALLATFRQTLAIYGWYHDKIVETLNSRFGVAALPLK
jgi:two-component sensor histidine kinase